MTASPLRLGDLIEKWTKERDCYGQASTNPRSDEIVQAMNRASSETCRAFLYDLKALDAALVTLLRQMPDEKEDDLSRGDRRG